MVKKITREELQDMIAQVRDLRLVDVLAAQHYEEEHIKGAISIPLQDIEVKAGKILGKNDLIVVYCASFDCMASTQAAEKLLSLGYKNVLDYKGGLKDYKEANLPLEGSLHKEASKTFSCQSC
ncbi:MAG: rhodanese-like domain-containing protein [Candidatus Omnitrophica bacterium]|nr:rhodanese-like domain-containing protein [Candidatus Omnitrophota bacterium]